MQAYSGLYYAAREKNIRDSVDKELSLQTERLSSYAQVFASLFACFVAYVGAAGSIERLVGPIVLISVLFKAVGVS